MSPPRRNDAGRGALRRRGPALCLAAGVLLALLAALVYGCAPKHPAGPRVLVIGLDGATFDVLDPLFAEGKLPNLARLKDAGASGTLESVLPAVSPPAWTTAVTGVNPGKHNVFDFFHFSKTTGEASLTSARERRAKPIWKVLNAEGKRVGLLNIPMTFPPDSVAGFMVSGFPFLDEKGPIAYPPELEEELNAMSKRVLGNKDERYPRDLFGEAIRPGMEAKLLERFRDGLECQAAFAKEKIAKGDWNLFWVVFTGTDKVQHFYWKFADSRVPGYDPLLAERYGNAIRDFWLRVDEVVGELREAAGPETDILVVSDHGFSPILKELRLSNWLKSEGFMTSRDDDPTKPVITAFPPGPFAGIVRVNEKGRDFQGTVEPGEDSERVRAEVRKKLEELKDPETGEPFVERIYNREELFHGPYVENAPDLVFLERKTRFVGRGGRDAPGIFGPPSYTFSGFHRPEGILLAAGPHIRSDPERRAYSILDVTPTLLWIFDAEFPKDLDGVVMKGLVGEDAFAARPPRIGESTIVETGDAISITEEGRDALEGLGYVR